MKTSKNIFFLIFLFISGFIIPQSINIQNTNTHSDSLTRLNDFELRKINSSDEIFMKLTYAGLVNTTIVAYYYKNEFYLPIKEIFDNLEIYNQIEGYKISGFFITHANRFEIFVDSNKVVFSDSVKNFEFNDYLKTTFDFYFNSEFYKKLFNINLKTDFSNLSVNVQSRELLPVYLRYQREKSYDVFSKKGKKEKPPLLYPRNRKLLGGAIFDYNVGYNISDNQSISTYYNFKLGGELLGGDGEASVIGNYDKSSANYNNFNYLWRYVFKKNPYLRTVTAGKVSLNGLYSINYSGIRISNDQVEPRRTYATHRVYEKTHANWTVEIYISNQLIAVTKADAVGDFHFDMPLSYGTTLLELKYYGPGGEYYEQTRLYQTPYYLLRPNEFRYFVNYGFADNIDSRVASIKGGYGVTEWLTTEFGYQYLENDPNENVFYNSTTARLMGEYLVNLTLAPNAYYKFSTDVLYFSQTSFGIEYKKYKSNGYMNPSNLSDDFGARFFVPFRFENYQLNFKGAYDYAYSDNVTLSDYSFGTSVAYDGFNPSITYNYIKSISGLTTNTRHYLDLGMSFFINSNFGLKNILTGNLLTFRAFYDTKKNNFENYTIGLATTMKQKARIQFSHSWNFNSNIKSFQIQLVMYLDDVQVNTSISNNGFRLGGLGSLTYDEVAEKIIPFNRSQVGRSTAAFRFFVDSNGNNLFDKDEEIIKGGGIRMGTSVVSEDKDGVIRARELDPYTEYSVEIDVSGIKNPLLVPGVERFSFIADPNTVKNIDIPFYVAGEIDGKVERKVKKGTSSVGGIKIHIRNLNDNSEITVTTFSDGTYYYFGLKPGKYIAYLDKKQLEIIGIKKEVEPLSFEIKTEINGDIIMNADFILE